MRRNNKQREREREKEMGEQSVGVSGQRGQRQGERATKAIIAGGSETDMRFGYV